MLLSLDLEVNCVVVKQCYVVCNNCSGHDNFYPDPYKDTFKEVVWPLSDRPYLKKTVNGGGSIIIVKIIGQDIISLDLFLVKHNHLLVPKLPLFF